MEESGDESNESDYAKEMESRVNPLHLIPQLTMCSGRSKRFDFKSGKAESDNDWASVMDDHRIALSGASMSSGDCEVVGGGGDAMYDLISNSDYDNFDDNLSMAGLDEVSGMVDNKKKQILGSYTPSSKSQLKMKML